MLVAALKGYLGDRFTRTGGSLTADEGHAIVLGATGDTELAERVRATIAQFEAARYAALNAQVDQAQIDEAIDLLRQVEEKAR